MPYKEVGHDDSCPPNCKTRHFVMPMPKDLKVMLDSFHWRMEEAEKLLADEQHFHAVFAGTRRSHYPLMRSALSAYLRENRD